MSEPRQILCIVKTDRDDAHARIADVSGLDATGHPWTMTQAEAVASAEAGTWRFYASVWGRPVWIVVATGADGDKYLKAETDGLHPNNLLILPECKAA